MKLTEDFPGMFEFCTLSIPAGWRELVYELTEKIHRMEPSVRVGQIKEKFGGLRYYTYGHNDRVDALIDDYERKSMKICDVCGEPGTLRENKGWMMTRCEEHK